MTKWTSTLFQVQLYCGNVLVKPLFLPHVCMQIMFKIFKLTIDKKEREREREEEKKQVKWARHSHRHLVMTCSYFA